MLIDGLYKYWIQQLGHLFVLISVSYLYLWRTHIAFLNIPFCNCRHVYTLMYLGSDHVNLCIVTNTSTTDCDFMFTPGLFLDMFLYF